MKELLAKYVLYLQAKGYSLITITDKSYLIDFFFSWIKQEGVLEIKDVSVQILKRYHGYILDHKQKNSLPLSTDRQRRYLMSVRDFFTWAIEQNYILTNPALRIDLPKLRLSLPGDVLSLEDIEKAIDTIGLNNIMGIRNRSVLELLLAAGLRTSEVRNLMLKDIDWDNRRITIRKSKGLKDRVLPLTRRCMFWLRYYITYTREKFLKQKKTSYLFLSFYGTKISKEQVLYLVKRIFLRAGYKANPRLIRHSFATLLLDKGLDIRYVQELLGHESLATTEIYTRVSIGRLKAVHKKTHPSEIKSLKEN